MRRGDRLDGLHGGSDPRRSPGDHWYQYRHGLMRSGLTVCTFMLAGAAEGDGGFACVPGSHKSNFIDRTPPEVRRFERRPAYVAQPAVEAGDVLIFTEALVHGTMPWTAGHQRRALLYKYTPGHSAWDQDGYRLSDYREFTFTERRKRIMQPPSIGDRPRTVPERRHHARTATVLTGAGQLPGSVRRSDQRRSASGKSRSRSATTARMASDSEQRCRAQARSAAARARVV